MPTSITYALLFAADLTIIGCLVHYFFATLHWYTPPFERPDRKFKRPDRHPPKLEKLKGYSYYALVFAGTFLALYGALSFLFSWMPPRWGTFAEGGEWTTTATTLSMFGAFFGMVALVSGLGKTAEKVSELQLQQEMAAAFRKLLERQVWHFRSILSVPETATDRLAKLEEEIMKAEIARAIYIEDAEVCRDLVRTFRQAARVPAPREPQPVIPSDPLNDILNDIKKQIDDD